MASGRPGAFQRADRLALPRESPAFPLVLCLPSWASSVETEERTFPFSLVSLKSSVFAWEELNSVAATGETQ